MNCNDPVVIDLSKVDVAIQPDEERLFTMFPIDQDGKKMLDNMLLVSANEQTFVVEKPQARLTTQIKVHKPERIGWNVDFRKGAVF